jgi:hypothetical protein
MWGTAHCLRLAPERRHHLEIHTVDEHTVDDEGHPPIVAARRALALGISTALGNSSVIGWSERASMTV